MPIQPQSLAVVLLLLQPRIIWCRLW